jgi:3-hydroxyisobutyrate dehydrogenase
VPDRYTDAAVVARSRHDWPHQASSLSIRTELEQVLEATPRVGPRTILLGSPTGLSPALRDVKVGSGIRVIRTQGEPVMGEPQTLGYIGLGVMGGRMCRNLLRKSGKPVVGYDVVPERMRACVEAGAEAGASVGDVVDRADMVFICVPGEPQVREVCFGDDGLIAHARRGQTIVDMTTATVEVDREVAAALAERGVGFADAPVARGVPAAENATLAITVGASDAVFRRIEPVLRCMGQSISHCGRIGNGQVMKLMNNMLIFQTVNALAEAMAIATRAGVDRERVFEILEKGSADGYVMRKHGTHMTSGEYPDDQFPITYSLKDLRYALDLAAKVGVDARGAKLVEQRFVDAIDRGLGAFYSPVIYKLFEDA